MYPLKYCTTLQWCKDKVKRGYHSSVNVAPTSVIVNKKVCRSSLAVLAPTFYQISYPAYNKTNMLRLAVLCTVYPKKYAHGFVVLCFVVVTQPFIMNSHEVFIHIHQGCFAGTGAIVRLPQCQWSKPDGYGKISQCITTTKHSKAKTVCIFLGIYCTFPHAGRNIPSIPGQYHASGLFSC